MNQVQFTDRIILKQLDEKHTDIVLDYFIRNKEFLSEWEAMRADEFYTFETQYSLLKKDNESFRNGTSLKLWIFKKYDKNKVIGCISVQNVVRSIMQSCILGYKLDKEEVGKGYITEALKVAIDIIFKEYNLHRIEAPVMPKNRSSINVLQKLGFTDEGVTKKMLKVNGVWEDHIRYSLLNPNDK